MKRLRGSSKNKWRESIKKNTEVKRSKKIEMEKYKKCGGKIGMRKRDNKTSGERKLPEKIE